MLCVKWSHTTDVWAEPEAQQDAGDASLTVVKVLAGHSTNVAFHVSHVLAPQIRQHDVLALDNLPVYSFGGMVQ